MSWLHSFRLDRWMARRIVYSGCFVSVPINVMMLIRVLGGHDLPRDEELLMLTVNFTLSIVFLALMLLTRKMMNDPIKREPSVKE